MPPKKGKRSAEEEEKLRQEEEARIKAEQEEEEKQRRVEQRKERLVELYLGFKESRFATEDHLSSQFNQSLDEEVSSREQRKKQEAWDQWMDQSGKPDCNSAPSISSFVSKCLENSVSRDEVVNERHLVHQLIKQLKHLSLDYPENRDQYHDAIVKLNEMQEERLDQLTLNYLLNPTNHIDPETEDLLYESKDDLSGLVYLMWGNFGKNPRRREVEWAGHKLKIELKKKQAIEDVALRVIWTADDTLSVTLPELIDTVPLAKPVEDAAEEEETPPAPEEETVAPVESTSITGDSEKKEPTPATSQIAPPESSKPDNTEIQSTMEEQGQMVSWLQHAEQKVSESGEAATGPIGLSGKEGIGGVWHIEYLSLPPSPKQNEKWTVTQCYGDELKRSHIKVEEPFHVALPLADYPIEAAQITIGRWDGAEWTQNGIQISEEKDGSMYFNTNELGAFRFFIDRHSPTGPLIDTWMIRPRDEIIEFHIILQTFQIQFDILPTGKVTLIETGEKPFFPPGTERSDIDLDALVADLEQRGLFVFPNEKSLEYIEKLDKVDGVATRAYSNIASVAHLKRVTSSSYNTALEQSEMAFMVDNDTLVCTSDRFYVIEDNYIPPEPPKPPEETEEEDEEAAEAFEEEKAKYDELIKEEESKFEPDFAMPRDSCVMLATLAEVLQVKSRISQQNLTVYKLLKKSMVLQL